MIKTVLKSQLKKRIIAKLSNLGFNIDEIHACVRSWEYASLSEKYSHGFDRILWLKEMIQRNRIIPNISLRESSHGIITHIEGKKSLGYLAAEKAIHKIIIAAKQIGVGIATISDCYPTGCMGEYTENITQSNQIGIAISHSSPRVTAFGAIDKVFGTMGHSFGFPAKIPYIYDSSIGSMTNGTIMHHYLTKTLFPENSVFTKEGVMTLNPFDVMDENGIFNGIIAIAGGKHSHKMSGLAGSLELLASLALLNSNINSDAYSFFMAIDPSFFGKEIEYRNIVTQLEDKITHARKINGSCGHIYYAGQKSYLLRKKNSLKKTVKISNETYKYLFFHNENTI